MQIVALNAPLDHRPTVDDFRLVEASMPICPDQGVLVQVTAISLDPYVGSRLRGRHMGEPAPRPLLEPIPGGIVGRVFQSRADGFAEGDIVHSMEGGWAEYVALPAHAVRRLARAGQALAVPLSAYLGVLGMPGLTAWAGITQLAKVGKGDVVLVDAAAGSVGGTAGQLARLAGASRVIGIAGGPEKCAEVVGTYGFDACVDYKAEGWREALKVALPDGLSVFFENVSAEMAMIALLHARPYARGVLCGLVDAYHTASPSAHALNAGLIIGKRANLHGLVVYDFYDRWDAFLDEISPQVASGRVRFIEDKVTGLAQAPALFERLMVGGNIGKCVVELGAVQ